MKIWKWLLAALKLKINNIITGDCLEILPTIPAESIDLILTDLPYEITSRNSWDKIIDPDALWKEYRRIIKSIGIIILTGWGLFSARMILSAPDLYKYTLIWKKNKPRGFLNAKKQPLRTHEDILVFYNKQPTYNPQFTYGHEPVHSYRHSSCSNNYGESKIGFAGGGSTKRYPTSIVEIPVVNNDSSDRYHPTQKPIELGEYLIRTYTNDGDIVLDNCRGSGSFLIAAQNAGRNYIGIEIDPKMADIARKRLKKDIFQG